MLRFPAARRLAALAVVSLAFVLSAGSATARSTGPPVARTGAPGESTCAAGLGCHTSFPLNDPAGGITLSLQDVATASPFTTYAGYVRERVSFDGATLSRYQSSPGVFSSTRNPSSEETWTMLLRVAVLILMAMHILLGVCGRFGK